MSDVVLHLGDCLEFGTIAKVWYNEEVKKLTDEHKGKISHALKKGAYFSCEVCEAVFWRKPRDIKSGNTRFCSRECYFSWQRGKNKTVVNPPIRDGSKNPNWRGGITKASTAIRNSKELAEWRQQVFERDDWTCQECGARSAANNYVRIEAHHIKPFAKFPEFRFVIDNGKTLCKQCHDKEPKGKEIWNVS